MEDCGFIFGDTERVKLGAVPALGIEQFIGYSTDTLIKIIASEEIPPEIKEKIKIRIVDACRRIEKDLIAQATEKGLAITLPDSEKVLVEKARFIASAFGTPERNYGENPFELEGNLVNISNCYKVTTDEFVFFSTQILEGGLFGFHPSQCPAEKLAESLARLKQAVDVKTP